MSDRIFSLTPDGTLHEFELAPYDKEERLQELLADHSELLAGDQVDPSSPRRWLLVERELGVPCEAGGSDRWNLDHLFLDQDGVPTFVEVKRSSDTRIRREVVGQMLDYAANATVYWPVTLIREAFERKCDKDKDPASVAAEALGFEPSKIEDYWKQVRANMQAGRVRLLFVADEIPPELLRIIEFLNAQMTEAEVLAVQVRQYQGTDGRTFVPRVLGHTLASTTAKETRPQGEPWTEARFLSAVSAQHGEEIAGVAEEIFDWARTRVQSYVRGRGPVQGSMRPVFNVQSDRKTLPVSPYCLWTSPMITVLFKSLKGTPGFASDVRRLELAKKLSEIPGLSWGESQIEREPEMPMRLLIPRAALATFKATMEWVIATAAVSDNTVMHE